MDQHKKVILYADFSRAGEFSRKTKNQNNQKIVSGSVRMNCGMYRTDKEKEKYIKDSLKRKLP